jgi:hypothetical protein
MAFALKGQSHENIMIFEVYRMKKKIGAMPSTLFYLFSLQYSTVQNEYIHIIHPLVVLLLCVLSELGIKLMRLGK